MNMKYAKQMLVIRDTISSVDELVERVKYIVDYANKHDISFDVGTNDINQYVCVCYVTGLTTAYCKGVCCEIKQMLKNSFNNKIDTIYFEY